MKKIIIKICILTFLTVSVSCITDFENITNYPYKVGDVFSEGGVMGIVYKISDDGLHGMIVSLNEIACEWGDTVLINAKDTTNGLLNMQKIKSLPDWKTKYPSFYWCDSKNGDGISGWYLPSKNELEEVMAQRVEINQTLTNIGGLTMFGKNYWTSTEYSQFEAYHANFIMGVMKNYALKINKKSLFVRAIKAF
jgi:hypothetical protein